MPTQFNAVKTTYNAQKDEWILSKITAIATQEDEMMKKTKSQAAFIVTIDKGKMKLFKGNSYNFCKIKKFGKPPQQPSMNIPNGHKNEVFKGICNFQLLSFFGHKKVDCKKFKT